MAAINFRSLSLDEMRAMSRAAPAPPLWQGFVSPGDVTLLTSQWKTGKTTLLAGLLSHLGTGEPFLGQSTAKAKALVVSEESPAHWNDRIRRLPIGPHAQLISRPFDHRPTPEEWDALIDEAVAMRRAGELDLFVVDPIITFLPMRSESEANGVLEALVPLHRLTAEGAAVLLLHHPRKKPSEEGQSARGSGALLGFVDVAIEMNRFSRLECDSHRRRLVTLSRKAETPRTLSFEWDRDSGKFTPIDDALDSQFEENWATLTAILTDFPKGATHQQLLGDWPEDLPRPSRATLYRWLDRGHAKGLVARSGDGTPRRPWRYRLSTESEG